MDDATAARTRQARDREHHNHVVDCQQQLDRENQFVDRVIARAANLQRAAHAAALLEDERAIERAASATELDRRLANRNRAAADLVWSRVALREAKEAARAAVDDETPEFYRQFNRIEQQRVLESCKVARLQQQLELAKLTLALADVRGAIDRRSI